MSKKLLIITVGVVAKVVMVIQNFKPVRIQEENKYDYKNTI
jgi:hypothetical protein